MSASTKKSISLGCLALGLLIVTAAGPLNAQMFFGHPEPGAGVVSQFPHLRGAIEQDMPGATIPWCPFIWPPRPDGELSVRPILVTMTQGLFQDTANNISLDFQHNLGLNRRILLVEFMGRFQLGRFSIRGNYDAYVRSFNGTEGEFQWPLFRVGLDIDLVQRNGWRLGVNLDGYPSRPTFLVRVPNLDPQMLSWPRPVTAGVHLAYNPFGFGGLSPSFETRCRWPLREPSRITEFEIAGGLKTPATILGRGALRGGWRYTAMEYRQSNLEVDVKWSGVFIEYVFLY